MHDSGSHIGVSGSQTVISETQTGITMDCQTPTARLPRELLIQVLQRLDLQQRLGCAAISSDWRDAALAAITKIKHCCKPGPGYGTFLQWLKQHGQQVTNLDLEIPPCWHGIPLMALPGQLGQHLRELRLSGFYVQLGQCDTSPGVLLKCQSLTRLCLKSCTFPTDQGWSSALENLTNLRDLTIKRANHSRKTDDDQPVTPCSIPPQLSQLTYLQLGRCVADSTLQNLSCLTWLKVLRLNPGSGNLRLKHSFTANALSELHLLPQLSSLAIWDAEHVTITSELPALQSLCLQGCEDMDQAVLSNVPQLRQLQLHNTTTAGGPEGMAALLASLGQLQRLSRLHFTAMEPTAPPAAYTNLLASSQLRHLELSGCNMPAAAWQHIFADAGQRPAAAQLQVLLISDVKVGESEGTSNPLQNLAQLLGLTRLQVCHVNDEGLEALAQLTGLERLEVYHGRGATKEGLQQLTALQHLTCLEFRTKSQACSLDDRSISMHNQADSVSDTGKPPVWRQLLKYCSQEEVEALHAAIQAAAMAMAATATTSLQLAQQHEDDHGGQVDALQQQLAAQHLG